MSHLMGHTLKVSLFVCLLALLSPDASGAETMSPPFRAPDLAVGQWLTPHPPQKADLIGRPYVIEFWASWCVPCQRSIKHMTEIQKRYSNEGLIIIAFAQDNSVDTVLSFIKQKEINYNVAMDAGNSLEYSVTEIPTVFIVNHEGIVVWRGYPWDGQFDKMVRKVVAEAPPAVTGGVALGPFEKYKDDLHGGKRFATAYRDIKTQSETPDNPDAHTARGIILAIDLTIIRRINQAHVLRYSEPSSAYHIYSELATRYGGIAVTQPAVEAVAAMKSAREIKPELYAREQTNR